MSAGSSDVDAEEEEGGSSSEEEEEEEGGAPAKVSQRPSPPRTHAWAPPTGSISIVLSCQG